jgi:hypothetical protein
MKATIAEVVISLVLVACIGVFSLNAASNPKPKYTCTNYFYSGGYQDVDEENGSTTGGSHRCYQWT